MLELEDLRDDGVDDRVKGLRGGTDCVIIALNGVMSCQLLLNNGNDLFQTLCELG